METDEIIRALRENAEWCDANEYDVPLCMGDNQREAADLIESLTAQLADYHHMSELVDGKMEENQRLRRINENLQAQLAASQHRERAAVEDAEQGSVCRTCHYLNNGCDPLNLDAGCHKWQWRGTQETVE